MSLKNDGWAKIWFLYTKSISIQNRPNQCVGVPIIIKNEHHGCVLHLAWWSLHHSPRDVGVRSALWGLSKRLSMSHNGDSVAKGSYKVKGQKEHRSTFWNCHQRSWSSSHQTSSNNHQTRSHLCLIPKSEFYDSCWLPSPMVRRRPAAGPPSLFEDIQGGARDLLGLQHLHQRSFVHTRAWRLG